MRVRWKGGRGMRVIVLILGLLLAACNQTNVQTEANVYTFYRNSILEPSMRIHVATFDSVDRTDYNRASCEEAAGLYRKHDTEKKNWWCEKGRYRP